MPDNLITPRSSAPATTPAAVEPRPGAEPAPEAAKPSKLPDTLLKLPVMQALVAGAPPAVSASLSEFQKRPEAKELVDNKDALMKAGFGLYRSLAGDTGVVFNQLHISGDEIRAADEAGQLQAVAPPFDIVTSEVGKAGQNNPVLNPELKVPADFRRAPNSPPQMNSAVTVPAPASAQRKTVAAKTQALVPKGPISGAQPGAGRILNSILKPVL